MRILHCVKNGEYIQNTSFRIKNNYSLDSIEDGDNELFTNSKYIASKIKFTITEKQISLPNFSIDPNANENDEIIKQSRSGLDLRLKKLFKDLSIEDFNKRSIPYRERLEYELNVITKYFF